MIATRTGLFILAFALACAAHPAAALGASQGRPRLVVVISVDQLCQDYLQRFREGFADDGLFNTVQRRGAAFANCHHRHAFTLTAPGHAVMLTGAYPNKTGVIGNGWFDPQLGGDRYAVRDDGVELVGLPEGKIDMPMSPASLLSETLGDVLKEATAGKAKVIGLSLKDRAGMLMAGRRADAAYWYSNRRWITSTWYRRELPGYLRTFNEGGVAETYAGRAWELLLPPERYQRISPDDFRFEDDGFGLGRAFPHKLAPAASRDFDRQFPLTPFGNDLTLHVARLLIEYEELGADETTDLLAVGLSSNDYAGHAYGPHSLEVQDMTCRTDRQLGDFLRYLDKQVGPERWTLALSADHGVAPIPELLEALKLPRRTRNPLGSLDALQASLEEAVRRAIGPPPEGKRYVLQAEAAQVYLSQDRQVLPADKLGPACEAVKRTLLDNDAVQAAVWREELLADGQPPEGINAELREQLRKAFHPQRSGEVLFVLKPYFIQSKAAATHGSPWEYDTHVPLLFLGAGIEPGRHETPASPAQIAPTLAKLLGVPPPEDCAEPALDEAVKRE